MQVAVYNNQGKEVKKIEVPVSVFDVVLKPVVVKQVVVAIQANQRIPYAHTKDRSEVRGGGRKPWKQKGTGRARHGSSRSPIWIGGGVTFGPRNDRNFSKKLNKKVRRLAIKMLLSDKARHNELIVLDDFGINTPKTKDLITLLQMLPGTKKRVLILTDSAHEAIKQSVKNIPKTQVCVATDVNAELLTRYDTIVVSEPALEKIISTFA